MCVCVCVCVCVYICMYVLSLHNTKMDNPLILQLLEKLHKTIHLCWIPRSGYKPSNRFSIANRKEKIEKRFVIRFFIFQFKNKNEL